MPLNKIATHHRQNNLAVANNIPQGGVSMPAVDPIQKIKLFSGEPIQRVINTSTDEVSDNVKNKRGQSVVRASCAYVELYLNGVKKGFGAAKSQDAGGEGFLHAEKIALQKAIANAGIADKNYTGSPESAAKDMSGQVDRIDIYSELPACGACSEYLEKLDSTLGGAVPINFIYSDMFEGYYNKGAKRNRMWEAYFYSIGLRKDPPTAED